MSALLSGETLEYFKPTSQFIFDSSNNLVGIQNPRSGGNDFRIALTSSTWANRPTSASATQLYLFTDLGASGTIMRYSGSRWRPLAGQAQLASLGAAVTGITNSETIVLQTLIPAGAWQTNDILRIWLTMTKSGTTDVGNITARIGTAGTTADAAVTGLSTFQALNTVGQSGGYVFDIKLVSATSAQRVGNAGNISTSYMGSSGTANPAVTVITDASANALYLSVAIFSGGATNTVAITSGQIQLITP